ncbi:MAG: hypothetical protein OXU20_16425 [Myxococcales bacterium]|nr:hypothetical protein [Myxococcales bacterium]MDD9970543.1 hypothetical protein [Myxococcales bacterium]
MVAKLVRTSDPGWLEAALEHYVQGQPFDLKDDAGVGLTARDVVTAAHLLVAAKRTGKLSLNRIIAAVSGLGIAGAGLWMIAAALADSEPTSKLGLLVGGGVLVVLTGGLGTMAALGVRFTVRARSVGGHVFEIRPDIKD